MALSVTLIIFRQLWGLFVGDKLKSVGSYQYWLSRITIRKFCPQNINNPWKLSVGLLDNLTKIRNRILLHNGTTSRVLSPGYKTQTNVCIGWGKWQIQVIPITFHCRFVVGVRRSPQTVCTTLFPKHYNERRCAWWGKKWHMSVTHNSLCVIRLRTAYLIRS